MAVKKDVGPAGALTATELSEALLSLAVLDRRGPALIVRLAAGGYLMLPKGYGCPLDSAYVISRSQLSELMHTAGLRRHDLNDPSLAARLSTLVDTFHQQRVRTEP